MEVHIRTACGEESFPLSAQNIQLLGNKLCHVSITKAEMGRYRSPEDTACGGEMTRQDKLCRSVSSCLLSLCINWYIMSLLNPHSFILFSRRLHCRNVFWKHNLIKISSQLSLIERGGQRQTRWTMTFCNHTCLGEHCHLEVNGRGNMRRLNIWHIYCIYVRMYINVKVFKY